MISSIAVYFLFSMAIIYLGGAIICAWALFKCMFNNRARQSLLSLCYGILITATSAFCVLPFLQMHVHVSDGDRLFYIGLTASNIALILFIIRSRFKAIVSVREKLT